MSGIRRLRREDRDVWLPLWDDYLEFYRETLAPEQTALTFDRLVDVGSGFHGALAQDAEGQAIGFVHWLSHGSTWSREDVCYLEDLFVHPAARGHGTGRALITHVEDWAREAGCAHVYWLTQAGNAAARGLYDQVAEGSGFVQYVLRPDSP